MPFSIAQRRPAAKTVPRPLRPAPSTFTLVIRQSGARLRMIPAHAVPWPKSSPCGSRVDLDLVAVLDDRRVLDAAADRRMVGVDAAVDHGHLDARARCCRPRPTRA